MKCKNCNNEISVDSKYCNHCGSIIDLQFKTCPNKACGKTGLPQEALFCPECGSQIDNPELLEKNINDCFLENEFGTIIQELIKNHNNKVFTLIDTSCYNDFIIQVKGALQLKPELIVVTFPVKGRIDFNSVIDILKMKMVAYGAAGSRKVTEADIPADLKSQAESLREALVEKVAESSEELLNNFFENGTLTAKELQYGIKQAIIKGHLIPAFAISTSRCIGVNIFLDFAFKYFPFLLAHVKALDLTYKQLVKGNNDLFYK